MDASTFEQGTQSSIVTIEEVNRLLEVGKILFSVLTPEELKSLQGVLSGQKQLGNTGDS